MSAKDDGRLRRLGEDMGQEQATGRQIPDGCDEREAEAYGQALDIVTKAGGVGNIGSARHVGNCLAVAVVDPSLMTDEGAAVAVGGTLVMEEASVPADAVLMALRQLEDRQAGTEDIRSEPGYSPRDEEGRYRHQVFENFDLWEWRRLARRRQTEIDRLERELAESRAQVDRLRGNEILRTREEARREACAGILPGRAEEVLSELEERVAAILGSIRDAREGTES